LVSERSFAIRIPAVARRATRQIFHFTDINILGPNHCLRHEQGSDNKQPRPRGFFHLARPSVLDLRMMIFKKILQVRHSKVFAAVVRD
jgi:hypothetical protein